MSLQNSPHHLRLRNLDKHARGLLSMKIMQKIMQCRTLRSDNGRQGNAGNADFIGILRHDSAGSDS
jgi:hypothetical protein